MHCLREKQTCALSVQEAVRCTVYTGSRQVHCLCRKHQRGWGYGSVGKVVASHAGILGFRSQDCIKQGKVVHTVTQHLGGESRSIRSSGSSSAIELVQGQPELHVTSGEQEEAMLEAQQAHPVFVQLWVVRLQS